MISTGPGAAPAVLDVTRAARWRAAAVPWWVTRVLLTVGWAVAAVAALATDDVTCTAADPGRCGPDLSFAWAVVPLVATPVLLCWLPLAGCLTGVLVAGLDLDTSPAARVAFGVHGALCAAVAGWLLVARRRQAAVAGEVSRPVRLDPAVADRVRAGLPGWGGRTLAAVVLIVAGAATVGWYRHRVGEVAGHVAAAVRLDATVLTVDEQEPAVTVRVPPRAAPPLLAPVPVPPARILVSSAAPYHVGQPVAVLADLTGGDPWVRLVAEPDDVTGWLSAGLGALALAGVLLVREQTIRAARRRLLRGPLSGVVVTAEPDGTGRVALHATDGERRVPLGGLPVVTDVAEPAADDLRPGPAEWAAAGQGAFERRREAVTVAGDLRDGGWVLLMTATGALIPAAPLRVHRTPPSTPGVPVDVPYPPELPELPVTLRPQARAVGALLLLGFLAGPALVLVRLPMDWWDTAVGLYGGGLAGVAGWGRLTGRVTLTGAGVTVHGATRVRHVPWPQLLGVRRDGARLVLARGTDTVVTVGPFDRAGHWGAVILGLRERARAAGDPAGDPTGAPTGRAVAGTVVAVAYAGVALGVFWWSRRG